MTAFEKLIKNFERFPGIGSRQAKRFAFHILTLPQSDVVELAELIRSVRSTIIECPSCFRFHTPYQAGTVLCALCSSGTRDHSKLTIVERDSDIDAIERSGMYDGLYFVLGGTVPLLNTQDISKLRGGALKRIVEERVGAGLGEIILGFSVNPDGENTARYIEMLLKEAVAQKSLKISYLGRGLSTGSELEYADPETIKNAFKNRG
jgi:recombination protein RecR